MKIITTYSCLFGIVLLLSCGKKLPSCACVGQAASGYLFLNLPLTQNPVNTSFTLNQTQFSGTFTISGEVHPLMTTNTGQWACDIIYRINNVEKFRMAYTNPHVGGAYDYTKPILGNLQLGTNTIEVGAECTQQPGIFCPIKSFTIILVQMVGNVTLTPTCCKDGSGKNTGTMKLLMAGTVSGGGSVPGSDAAYIKVEEKVGQTWVQVVPNIPFNNGQFTPCYQTTWGVLHEFRAQLIDNSNTPLPNNGTTFPRIFQNCSTCCPIPPRE